MTHAQTSMPDPKAGMSNRAPAISNAMIVAPAQTVTSQRWIRANIAAYLSCVALIPPRLFAQQRTHEEILQTSLAVRTPRDAVTRARHDGEFVILVRFDERVADLHRGRRIDVPVEFADYEQ